MEAMEADEDKERATANAEPPQDADMASQEVEQVPEEDPAPDASAYKTDGNEHFGAKRYPEAVECYQAGLALLSEGDDKSLEVALRSNLAMALLKINRYQEAERECTRAVQVDKTNAKAWFRRALAREGLAASASTEEETLLLMEGLKDLKTCLSHLQGNAPQTKKMKRATNQALERIQATLQQQQQEEEEATVVTADHVMSNGDHGGGALPPEQAPPASTTMPSPDEQRQDVMRLLTARASEPQQEGEAFFLLNYKWWTSWCHHVDFFANPQEALQLLPPGAMVPRHISNNDDDDSSTSSGSSDEDDDESFFLLPPQEIDNSALYYKQTTIKPNLVRGHHYELVPREVYHALRLWYGEVTEPICRRVNNLQKLPLYPESNGQQNGKSHHLAKYCGACQAPSATKRCHQCRLVHYCTRSCQESHWPYHKYECKQQQQQQQLLDAVSVGPADGRVGLHNLGNTCFMNSALQCLSHATPLTRHFLSNKFREDLNESNPLGTGGKLAKAYEAVLKDIWIKPGSTAISPTALKRAIAVIAPRFGGCLQHDAQEFLAYLLDGLHEDLNRIRDAPYVKMPNVAVDESMAIAGAKAWDAHRRRNDSLVMDTFYGQFKSTCVCPKCNQVSTSFDAFNHVSLELPQQQEMTRILPIFVFQEGKAPVRYAVTVPRRSPIRDLQGVLSKVVPVTPGKVLCLCEIYEHHCLDLLNENKPISSIRDVVGAYEVDQFTTNYIHVLARHEIEGRDGIQDLDAELEASVEDGGNEAIGKPFVTSFDVNFTCQQVWEHVWQAVKHLVVPVAEEGEEVGDDVDDTQYRALLKIRIVDIDGRARPVFLDENINDPIAMDLNNELDPASILPPTSDEKIVTYLGKDCETCFVFFKLEWLDTTPDGTAIDKERFSSYTDHESVAEAVEKARQRAANDSSGITLDKCFEAFTKPERLDEHNKWYCSKCKEHVRGMKTMQIWRLPNILVVHLKRFEFKHTLRREKLDTFVDFPLDGLDMSKHCASTQAAGDSFVEDNVPAIYDLFAVTNHYGRLGFGHYTAFARRWDEHGMSDDWALFDDSSVHSVGDGIDRAGHHNGIVSPAAYVLFYRRRVFH